MRMPSSKIDREVPEVEPGVAPADIGVMGDVAAEEPDRRPRDAPGVMIEMSGRWLPPAR